MPFGSNVYLAALLIFVVRVISITLATWRFLIMGRANKLAVAGIAFFEALTFALTFGAVAQDLTNVWNLLAYCGGFASGTFVGTAIEQKLAQGYATVHVVSMTKSLAIVEAVREAGFGATRTAGEGGRGAVGMIFIVVRRRDIGEVLAIVDDIDPKAFITVDETRAVSRGFLGYGRS
jgi:uncharacterized protein YebE (UPF0316 family)